LFSFASLVRFCCTSDRAARIEPGTVYESGNALRRDAELSPYAAHSDHLPPSARVAGWRRSSRLALSGGPLIAGPHEDTFVPSLHPRRRRRTRLEKTS